MTEDEFNALSEKAYAYLRAKQAAAQDQFKIGSYERFDWDQETMQLVWSDAGVAKVIADIQFVGSISTKSNTWLWAWANPTVLSQLSHDVTNVREYGHAHGIEKLTKDKWAADEIDGWEMTAITTYILKAQGAYRSPDGDGFTFMVFTEIRFAGGQTPTSDDQSGVSNP